VVPVLVHNPADYATKPEQQAAWLKARTLGIGASEVATLFGLNPWGSEYQTWMNKVQPDTTAPLTSSRAEWGHRHEAAIAKALVEDVDFLAEFGPGDWAAIADGRLFQHPTCKHVLATPDYYVVNQDGLFGYVECKSSTQEELWSGGVPRHVYLQVQQQMAVLGESQKFLIVAWLLNGWDFHWQRVNRDERTIAEILERVEAWWARHVDGNVAPPVDGSDATSAAVARRYGKPTNDDVVALPGDLEALDAERLVVQEQLKNLETRKSEIDNRIKDAIGTHAKGMLPSGVAYSWSVQERKEHTVKASSARVLRRISPKGEKS
jgi:putative phage-type endonuclease